MYNWLHTHVREVYIAIQRSTVQFGAAMYRAVVVAKCNDNVTLWEQI